MSFEHNLEKAWTCLENDDVTGARRIGSQLGADAPDSAEIMLLLAACDREEGKAAEALKLLARAAEADPTWAVPPLWSAELLAADPDRLAEALQQASVAMERAEEADEFLDAVTLKAGLEVDLGKRAAARKTLAELPALGKAPLPPLLALELANLFLAVDDTAEAQRRFQALIDEDATYPDAWYGLGLAAEIAGDEDERRRAWLRTRELDARSPIEDPILTEAQMEEVASAALGELPERAKALIRNVPIVIADLPAAEDVERGLDPRLLGLFEGTSHPEASNLGGNPHLARIILFRKNLERAARDEQELRDEVRITLLHETGHFFGMSEEDLTEAGLD